MTLLGLGLRAVGIAHTSHTSVLNTPLADDSFYYFSLARNAALGPWPVISGDGAPTSGFQPLWGALTSGLDVAVGGFSADGRIVAAQILGALVSLLAGFLVLDLMLRLGAGWAIALLAFGAFLLSPQVLKHSLNGMETSLALLAVVGLFRLWATFDPARASRRAALGMGVAGGMAMLARLDLVMLVGVGVVATGVTRARRSDAGKSWAAVETMGLMGIGVLVPWIAWAAVAAAGGAQPVPEAGSAVRNLTLLLQGLPPLSPVESLRQADVFAPVYAGYVVEFTSAWARQVPLLLPVTLPLFALLPLGAALAASTALAGAAAAALILWARRGPEPLRRLTAMWVAYAVLMTVGYSCVVLGPWFYQRYGAPVAVTFHILLLAAGAAWLEKVRRVRALQMVAALGIALGFGALMVEGSYRWIVSGPSVVPDDGWYRAVATIDRMVPPGARVGVFSAGLVTYYARQPVLALDGKVSGAARRAMEAGEMLEYVCREDIEYVVDWEKTVDRLLKQRSAAWPGGTLELMTTVQGGEPNDILVYRLDRAACRAGSDGNS